MDELSPAAQIIGAINTIVNDNGKLTGCIAVMVRSWPQT